MFLQIKKIISIFILISCSNIYCLELSNQIFIQSFKISPNEKSFDERFRLKRGQIKLIKKINKNIFIEFAHDFQSISKSEIKPYLKTAFISWNPNQRINYTFGYQFSSIYGPLRMNWRNPSVDGVSGVVNDFHQIIDFGLSFKWNIKNDLILKSGIFNGTGYKLNENDRFKKIELLLFKGKEILTNHSNNYGVIFSFEPYENTNSNIFFNYRYGLFFGKSKELNRIGIEYHLKSNNETKVQKDLFTIYSTNKLRKKINLINRFEFLREFENHNPFFNYSSSNLNYTFGLLISLSPNVSISPSSKFSINEKDNFFYYKLNFIIKSS